MSKGRDSGYLWALKAFDAIKGTIDKFELHYVRQSGESGKLTSLNQQQYRTSVLQSQEICRPLTLQVGEEMKHICHEKSRNGAILHYCLTLILLGVPLWPVGTIRTSVFSLLNGCGGKKDISYKLDLKWNCIESLTSVSSGSRGAMLYWNGKKKTNLFSIYTSNEIAIRGP